MQNVYELYRAGLLTTITIKDVSPTGTIQVSIKRHLKDETSERDIINSTMEMYFTPREFKEFFEPIFHDMKARFYDQNTSESNT